MRYELFLPVVWSIWISASKLCPLLCYLWAGPAKAAARANLFQCKAYINEKKIFIFPKCFIAQIFITFDPAYNRKHLSWWQKALGERTPTSSCSRQVEVLRLLEPPAHNKNTVIFSCYIFLHFFFLKLPAQAKPSLLCPRLLRKNAHRLWNATPELQFVLSLHFQMFQEQLPRSEQLVLLKF